MTDYVIRRKRNQSILRQFFDVYIRKGIVNQWCNSRPQQVNPYEISIVGPSITRLSEHQSDVVPLQTLRSKITTIVDMEADRINVLFFYSVRASVSWIHWNQELGETKIPGLRVTNAGNANPLIFSGATQLTFPVHKAILCKAGAQDILRFVWGNEFQLPFCPSPSYITSFTSR